MILDIVVCKMSTDEIALLTIPGTRQPSWQRDSWKRRVQEPQIHWQMDTQGIQQQPGHPRTGQS